MTARTRSTRSARRSSGRPCSLAHAPRRESGRGGSTHRSPPRHPLEASSTRLPAGAVPMEHACDARVGLDLARLAAGVVGEEDERSGVGLDRLAEHHACRRRTRGTRRGEDHGVGIRLVPGALRILEPRREERHRARGQRRGQADAGSEFGERIGECDHRLAPRAWERSTGQDRKRDRPARGGR